MDEKGSWRTKRNSNLYTPWAPDPKENGFKKNTGDQRHIYLNSIAILYCQAMSLMRTSARPEQINSPVSSVQIVSRSASALSGRNRVTSTVAFNS